MTYFLQELSEVDCQCPFLAELSAVAGCRLDDSAGTFSCTCQSTVAGMGLPPHGQRHGLSIALGTQAFSLSPVR